MKKFELKPASHAEIISATQSWLEKAVIGLNLCPFAKAVHVKQQIRYVVSDAVNAQDLYSDLLHEIQFLLDADPAKIDTTLLILPSILHVFLDFNDFLAQADNALGELNAHGLVQIASFHPDYQFVATEPDDIENYTNRAPHPTLHLLREESISRAVDSYPDTDEIFQKNQAMLNKLGIEGWHKLFT